MGTTNEKHFSALMAAAINKPKIFMLIVFSTIDFITQVGEISKQFKSH